jgi:hypothetical protein
MHASVVKQRQIPLVTTGLDPVVHADVRLHTARPKLCFNVFAAWIAGSSPAMTKKERKKKGSGTPADALSSVPHQRVRSRHG